MKKVTSICCCLFFGINALLLFGNITCSCIGYSFELANTSAYAIFIVLLSVLSSVLSIISGKTARKSIYFLLIFNVPLSIVNVFVYLFECTSSLVYVCTLVTAAHALFLAVWHGRNLVFQIITSVSLSLVLLAVCYLGFFCLLFGNIGCTTVMQTIESPSATYRAEVLDIDQGALGGDTAVQVYENNKHYELFLFTISKKPQRVYIGNWGEFKSMRIRWEDEHCLMINSRKYHIE